MSLGIRNWRGVLLFSLVSVAIDSCLDLLSIQCVHNFYDTQPIHLTRHDVLDVTSMNPEALSYCWKYIFRMGCYIFSLFDPQTSYTIGQIRSYYIADTLDTSDTMSIDYCISDTFDISDAMSIGFNVHRYAVRTINNPIIQIRPNRCWVAGCVTGRPLGLSVEVLMIISNTVCCWSIKIYRIRLGISYMIKLFAIIRNQCLLHCLWHLFCYYINLDFIFSL